MCSSLLSSHAISYGALLYMAGTAQFCSTDCIAGFSSEMTCRSRRLTAAAKNGRHRRFPADWRCLVIPHPIGQSAIRERGQYKTRNQEDVNCGICRDLDQVRRGIADGHGTGEIQGGVKSSSRRPL
jgi:hypothetical protein